MTKKKKEELNTFLNKQSNFKISELLLFAILIVIGTIILTLAFNNLINNKSSKSLSNGKTSIKEFEEVYSLIKKDYYKEVDESTLMEGAIEGMLSSLKDPHTNYLTKEVADDFNSTMNGSYEGIGAEISIDNNNNIIIFSVFKNSPAYEEGLKFNDIILSVNDKSTEGLTPTEVVTYIKDKDKPTAHLKIKRGNEEKDLYIKKRIVVIETVEDNIYEKNNRKIGYIMINSFAENTYEQFRNSIESLEEKGINSLIIDVRGNTGGYLHSVSSMLDILLPKNTILYQIETKGNIEKYTSTSDEYRNYPIAVLVDKSSASASEILSVGLKEAYKAEIIGTSTYGKGTVQITKDLSNGAMIKYTIQKWLSPKGNWINDIGVEPTIKVELSENYFTNPMEENDTQLQKALEILSKK